MIDWSLYPNFSKEEFDCKHTGNNEMKPDALEVFQAMRDRLGFPLIVTSGYRDPTHPIEQRKEQPGSHAAGTAADFFATNGELRFKIIQAALECGAVGIGINRTFIHVDVGHPHMPRPAAFPY